jgi:hypothetical protein
MSDYTYTNEDTLYSTIRSFREKLRGSGADPTKPRRSPEEERRWKGRSVPLNKAYEASVELAYLERELDIRKQRRAAQREYLLRNGELNLVDESSLPEPPTNQLHPELYGYLQREVPKARQAREAKGLSDRNFQDRNGSWS